MTTNRERCLGESDFIFGWICAPSLHTPGMRRRALLPVVLPLAMLVAASCGDNGSNAITPPGPDAEAGTPIADATLDVPFDHPRVPYEASKEPTVARVKVTAESVSTRADVQALMFAAGEMQISGEPFAEGFAGRKLDNYDRTYLPPDQYINDNGGDAMLPITDIFGYSTAVESYEYSKYHMNMVAQQTGCGLSLANGPVVASSPGATLLDKLRALSNDLMTTAGTDVAGYALLPPPLNNPQNFLGFRGLWPVFAPFKSFDPALKPHHEVVKSCTFQGGYGGIPTIGETVPEYECAYNSLHLGDTAGADTAADLIVRAARVEPVIGPGVMGLATWKEALWAIDFIGRLHDATSNPVETVANEDRAKVGTANNLVLGTQPAGATRGTYIGSTPLEGMWGLIMLSEMENAAEWLTGSLMTSNGTTLAGFPTRTDAASYDYTSPLRWFPAGVTATEDLSNPFPKVTGLSIADAQSRSEDLAALLLGHAMFFGMTDPRNAALGQLIGLQLTFDGSPFAADDGLAGHEDTMHDRALAVLRVAFIDLDRMHGDKTLGVTVDTATAPGGVLAQGATVTTTSLAHVVIALRQTLLTLNGAITQYGAADPDPAIDAKGILNPIGIHPLTADAGAQPTFSARVRSVLSADAAFVRDVLTKTDGSVANGATIASGVATASTTPATVESQAAAVRALTEGFLVSGDETYRTRARAVATRLQTAFYSPAARMYRGVQGGADEIHMTPERFGWLQSALRETHKVLHVAGDASLSRIVLEERIGRTNKLFLNGWDDLDGDEQVNIKTECLGARLQMSEQALTGELGRDEVGRSTSDRDEDCVPEIDNANVASVLAREVFFHAP